MHTILIKITLVIDTSTTVAALVSPGSSPTEISSWSWIQDESDESNKIETGY